MAEVRLGSAIRYGALTYNGEVDAVGGVVMMLKGENSHEVVSRIKEKLPTIQQSLPDDVVIEPFLDRTDLVQRAIHTVEKKPLRGGTDCHLRFGTLLRQLESRTDCSYCHSTFFALCLRYDEPLWGKCEPDELGGDRLWNYR